MREREGLITRIRYLRRLSAASPARSAPAGSEADPAPVYGLEERMAHLEQLLEGLQDSVYREAERQSKRIAELEARIDPAAMGAALNRDAREHGL